ncbi:MAG: hypothetical protein ABSD02_06745 [Steroidobacteraceae bacterium]|jgi:ABC-type transport system involved in multi-copper enzyme maturation permease subunit
MILRILKKDWILLWPMVVLVTAIQAALEWAIFSVGLFGDSPAAAELLHPLTLAWFLGIAALTVALVQQDAIPGVDQDWLIRPLKRRDLLAAKLLFVLLFLCAPMFALNLAHALVLGFPVAVATQVMAYKELYVFGCLMLPLLALAATTRNMTELTLWGAILFVVYALISGVSALLLGASRCPTCDSGLVWLEHLLQHLGILLGAALVLYLQYFRRRTGLSRALAVAGVIALVFAQLPWNAAFSLQRVLGGSLPDSAVTLEYAGDPAAPAGGELESARAPAAARRATQALLHGDLDQATAYLQRRAQAARPYVFEVPVRISGVADDELLLVDRSEVELTGDKGRILYRGADIDESPNSLNAPLDGEKRSPGSVPLTVRVPAAAVGPDARSVRLRLEYSLTLMRLLSEHEIPAIDGAFRSAEIGLCESRLEGDSISVRCLQIGRTPFCYSATLYGPDGTHNPEVRKCVPDYRPYIPAFTNALNFVGVDLPVRDRYGLAHYAVDATQLDRSRVRLKIYRERDHFKRTLSTATLSVKRS